jgi:hypothetical protein
MSQPAIAAAEEFAERSPEITSTRTIAWQDPVPTAAAGAQMAGLDYVRAIQAGELPPPPIGVVMNYSIAELEEAATPRRSSTRPSAVRFTRRFPPGSATPARPSR